MVDTEGEVEMSGTSHSKGIMILGGYIGQKYAQDIPLSLTASLCFEQLYGGGLMETVHLVQNFMQCFRV